MPAPKKPAKPPETTKAERLAAALRENLKKRKQQARDRAAGKDGETER